MFKHAAFGTLLAVAMVAPACQAAEHTRDSLKTVKENVDARKAVLVDVREKSEWDSGHVAGAVFLPLSELRNGIDLKRLMERLPKGTIVYTHCAIGKRSLAAGDVLSKHGYNVRPLKPGYSELLQSGFQKADK